MTKVAAVAPILAGLSAPAALGIGAALLGGSQLLNSYGQKKHVQRQNEANQRWLAYQNDKTRRFEAKDAQNKARADAALEANLAESDVGSRNEVIANEEARLADEFTANLPEVADAIRGSGQESGRSEVFDADMARRVGNATKEARDRMKAMATATAYGGGSMGSMGMTDMLRNLDTGIDLGGINDRRMGDVSILRRYQTVQPEMLEYEQSPLVPIMNAAGSFFLGGGAQNLGGMLGNLGKNAGTAATSTSSPGAALASVRPTPRPWVNPMAPIGYVGMDPSGFA